MQNQSKPRSSSNLERIQEEEEKDMLNESKEGLVNNSNKMIVEYVPDLLTFRHPQENILMKVNGPIDEDMDEHNRKDFFNFS